MGSMNGLGVLVSLKMGKLIATLDPRRRRMFAVSVLKEPDRVVGYIHTYICVCMRYVSGGA